MSPSRSEPRVPLGDQAVNEQSSESRAGHRPISERRQPVFVDLDDLDLLGNRRKEASIRTGHPAVGDDNLHRAVTAERERSPPRPAPQTRRGSRTGLCTAWAADASGALLCTPRVELSMDGSQVLDLRHGQDRSGSRHADSGSAAGVGAASRSGGVIALHNRWARHCDSRYEHASCEQPHPRSDGRERLVRQHEADACHDNQAAIPYPGARAKRH